MLFCRVLELAVTQDLVRYQDLIATRRPVRLGRCPRANVAVRQAVGG